MKIVSIILKTFIPGNLLKIFIYKTKKKIISLTHVISQILAHINVGDGLLRRWHRHAETSNSGERLCRACICLFVKPNISSMIATLSVLEANVTVT